MPFVVEASVSRIWVYVFYFLTLYLAAQFLAATIDLLRGTYKATFNNFFLLWRSYLFMTLIHLLLWVLAVPLFLFLFLIGPVAFIGGLIALCLLLIYFLQIVLGFHLVAHPPGGGEALWALLFLTACGLLFLGLSRLLKRNVDPTDRFVDFYIHYFLKPAQRRNSRWLQGLQR